MDKTLVVKILDTGFAVECEGDVVFAGLQDFADACDRVEGLTGESEIEESE